MGNTAFAAFTKKWAIVTAALWVILAIALVVQVFRPATVQTGGMPPLPYQIGAVVLGAVTALAWLFVSIARRQLDVSAMGLVLVVLTGWMVQSAFVERAVRAEAPSVATGLVSALMIAGMGVVLLWQAQAFRRKPAVVSPAIVD